MAKDDDVINISDMSPDEYKETMRKLDWENTIPCKACESRGYCTIQAVCSTLRAYRRREINRIRREQALRIRGYGK